jgi:hypothetical protein
MALTNRQAAVDAIVALAQEKDWQDDLRVGTPASHSTSLSVRYSVGCSASRARATYRARAFHDLARSLGADVVRHGPRLIIYAD